MFEKQKRMIKGWNVISAVMYTLVFNNAPSRRRRMASLEDAKIILFLTEASSGDLLIHFLLAQTPIAPDFPCLSEILNDRQIARTFTTLYPNTHEKSNETANENSTHQTIKHSLFLTPSPPGKVNSKSYTAHLQSFSGSSATKLSKSLSSEVLRTTMDRLSSERP